VSLALADDIKTINGKEYKNATVSRVEPDGIVLKSKSGVSKVYFTELPKEVQERFHYDSAKSAKSNAAEQAAAAQSNAAAGQEQQQQHAEWHYQDIQDPMGRHGPERHAFVKSADGNAKLSLSWDGQTATVSLTTVNVMSSDEYYATIITMRMDDRPAYDYELHIDRESFRYGLIVYARPAYRPGSSGEWSQFSPGDFITGLKSTHILRVEVPIHGQGSIVYTFPVEGLVW